MYPVHFCFGHSRKIEELSEVILYSWPTWIRSPALFLTDYVIFGKLLILLSFFLICKIEIIIVSN